MSMTKLKFPFSISRYTLLTLFAGGLAGIGFLLLLTDLNDHLNTEEFCTSCHSMELVAEPYRTSPHYRPTSGVRAVCGDCHVSEGIMAATWDHIKGGKDLFKQLFGPDYDDPVINALHLPEAAFSARQWFLETDSATCKRCHVKEAIFGWQPDTILIHSEDAKEKTCIECHYNLVHRKIPDQSVFKRDKWNRMIEKEFGLKTGEADKILGK
jgi:nitrate/TMAO reductase-like tetraheme cytochrome c subunit